MRILILLIITFFLAGCTSRPESIDFSKVLENASRRATQNRSLIEDTLLCQALEYYRRLEPKDSVRLQQATILTAFHYWWKGEKAEAYELLHTITDSDKDALWAVYQLACKDYDYEAGYRYLNRIMEDETEKNFANMQALATLNYYLNRPEECKALFDNIHSFIRTSQDSMLYWVRVLPNYADILSDYGEQKRAIELQRRVLDYFVGKDSARVSMAHVSLARYYLLQNNLKEAETQIMQAERNANATFKNDLSVVSYMQLLRSILNYATDKRIDMKEWANFVNKLAEDFFIKQANTDAKETVKRQLNEQNLMLTIEKQRTQITLIYMGIALFFIIAALSFYHWKRKCQMEEKEEELETLRKLVTESQQYIEQKDDRFFKKIMLQQLGVIRMAASNPTAANQELIRRMTAIANKEVQVESLLNWNDLYKTIDYIYDDYYTRLMAKYGNLLNEKEVQLCCLLRANFSTKEISIVSQQSVRTVYQRKSVIRQKLGMEEKGDIIDFLA